MIFISINSFCQMNTNLKQFFYDLDHQTAKTNYLWNYGFVIFYDIDNWYHKEPVMANLTKWFYIYNSIQKSNLEQTNYQNQDSLLLSYNSSEDTIPISILCYEGDYINRKQFNELYENTDKKVYYEQFKIFSGITLRTKINKNITYKFLPELFFTNIEKQIKLLQIDFCDDNGFQNINKPFRYSTSYHCQGKKTLTYRLITTGEDTIIAYSTINILPDYIIKPDYIGTITADTTQEFSLFKQEKSNPLIDLPYASYLYIEGTDHELNKPIVFIEGFDIDGTLTLEKLEQMINERLDIQTFRERGYDIFIVNLAAPDYSLFDNAYIVEKLIRGINRKKTGNYETSLIGFSMGGLLCRIALKRMENNNYNHQVGLYVSFDSPHKGANIPMGLQFIAKDIDDRLMNTPELIGLITDIIEEIFEIDIPYADLYYMLNCISAKQMLIYHHIPNDNYSQMQEYFNTLGYPQYSRNVTCVSGSNTAQQQEMPFFTDRIMQINKFYSADIYYGQTNQNVVLAHTYIKLGNWEVTPHNYYFNYGIYDLDIAPGGNMGTGQGMYNFFCFIPSVSALDIKSDIWNSGNLDYYNENISNRNSDYLIDNNLTPFDDIYSNSANSFHCDFNQAASSEVLYNDLKIHEIMYDSMFLQNREITQNRDFEATDKIIVGKDVSKNLTDSQHKKHIDTGNFIITDSSTVNFKAGHEIILKAGFEVTCGSEFSAKIDSTLMVKNIKNNKHYFYPKILGHKTFNDTTTLYTDLPENIRTNWKITGYDTTFYYYGQKLLLGNLPVGQYTVFCDALFLDTTISVSSIIKVKNFTFTDAPKNQIQNKKNIKIFPNPANNYVKVILTDQQADFDIYFFAIDGTLLLLKKHVNSNQEINIEKLPLGAYLLTIKSDNYVWHKKFIKN